MTTSCGRSIKIVTGTHTQTVNVYKVGNGDYDWKIRLKPPRDDIQEVLMRGHFQSIEDLVAYLVKNCGGVMEKSPFPPVSVETPTTKGNNNIRTISYNKDEQEKLLDLMAQFIAKSLYNLYYEIELEDCNLIFPTIGSKKRASEQEARVLAMIFFFQNRQQDFMKNIKFAFEVPTDNKFIQTGRTGGTLARYDITLFKQEPLSKKFARFMNIEFKAKQVVIESISKDFEKLLIDNYPSCFFHYLPDTTVQHEEGVFAIINKMYEAFHHRTKSLPMNTPLKDVMKETFSYDLVYYLYELHAKSLFKIVFNKDFDIDLLKQRQSFKRIITQVTF